MDLHTWLDVANGKFVTGLLIFVRFSAVLFAAPMLGGRVVPTRIRLGLGALFGVLLTPLVPMSRIDSLPWLVVGVGKEVIVGLLIGWTAMILFASVQIAGEWLDLPAGFQASQILNPSFDVQNSLMGSFLYQLAGVIFLATGGLSVMLRAAVSSLQLSPPGALQLFPGGAGSGSEMGGSSELASLMAQLFWIALQLAAPIAAALFLAEIAMGLIHRAMPQVNLMMLTMPLKSLLALSALAISVPVLAATIGHGFGRLGSELLRMLGLL